MARHKAKAPKTWARIIEIKSKLGRARSGATDEEIIAAFREKYDQIIRVENKGLVDIALKTILNSVCNLNGKPEGSAQLDLFQGYNLPLTLTVLNHNTKSGSRKVKKNFDAMTKSEVLEYIADHNTRPPRQSRRTLEVIRFFEDNARNFGDQNSTMRECWQAAHAKPAAKPANEP